LCSETLGHADIAARTSAHQVDTRGALQCPSCHAPLQRVVVGQTSVEVDYCTAHGTWFDKNELNRVAQSFATARAYGRHGSAALAGGAVAGAAVAGTAVAAGAVAVAHSDSVQRHASALDAEDAVDMAELAVEGGSAAFEVGEAVGGAVDAAEVAGGVFEILGGLFEGLG
jgi:hypothetical protein